MRSKILVLSSLLFLLASCTPTYIVIFSGSVGGSVSNIGGEYDEGATVSVSAQPETGYEFLGWSDGSSQNPRTVIVTESLNLTAFFGKQQFSVSVNTQGEGTVSASGATGQGSFEYGSSARFDAVPAAGWEFDSWSGDATGTVNPLSIYIEGPITVTATFKRQKFDLIVTVEGEGTVTEEVLVQPGQYDYETQVKLTATAEEGWTFTGWTGDLASTENPVTVTVTEAKEVTATFIRKKYDLTVTVQGEGSVEETVIVQPGQYDYETQVKLTATPEDGWAFAGWTGDLASTDNPVTVTVTEAKEVTATFIRKKYDLTVTVVGEGTVSEEVVVQPGQYDYETQVKLTATPEDGWAFAGWTGDVESTDNPVTVTVTEAKEVTATFIRKKYDLTVTVVGEGTVSEEVVVQPGQYDYETQVKLTATSADGWTFAGWTGDVESTDNPINITLNDKKRIVGVFTNPIGSSGLNAVAFNHPTFDVINPTPWLEWKDQLSASLKDESIDTEDFIWNALNIWYFWKAQTPALSETRFTNVQDYLDYLKGFSSAESMIESITNTEDRFTFFNEDYSVLINSLGGISKSDGLEFGLVANTDSEDVIIYTRYVARGSSAEAQGVQRGDLFNRIDGQLLTRSNYSALINNRVDTYTLGRAQQDASGDFLNAEGEVTLTRVENFQENPVQFHSVFTTGNKKVGYLVYNQFISNYNQELNEIFATFKSNAIEELIIDLRYNPGGSTAAAGVLASMIHDGSGVFAKQRWNTYWTSLFGSSLEDRFTDQITVDNATVPLNRLGMKRVYVLTQSGTASSSELLINGLSPYIEVIQIGETTRGKNEFSITLVDDPGSQSGQTVFPYLFQSSRVAQINPNNSFALQPLVGKYENSVGFSDYTNGLDPLITYSEIERINGRISFNIGSFGSLEDGLFAQAIAHMNGGLTNQRAVRSLGEPAEDLRPSEALMFVEFWNN